MNTLNGLKVSGYGSLPGMTLHFTGVEMKGFGKWVI